MLLKKKLLAAVLAFFALTPALALAQPSPHRHDRSCAHQATPVPAPQGRYQLRTVQKWVEGGYQQVWVPSRCTERRYRTVCTHGGYQKVFQPGHYQSVQEYVWVTEPGFYSPGGFGRGQGRAHGRWASAVR